MVTAVINVVKEDIIHLHKVLESIKGFVDEVVIVDMTLGLDVKDIAAKFTASCSRTTGCKAKVYTHKFVDYVEPARNFGIEKASGEWIYILDPDEESQKELNEKLAEIVDNSEAEFVRVPRKNVVFGKWLKHSRWWPDYNIRFFKKGYVEWDEVIHSVPITTGRGIELEDKEKYAITHHHYDSIEQYLERMNRYTGRQSESIIKKGYQFYWSDLIIKPANEFFSRFFFGSGYKDGIHGLSVSLLQAVSELVVYLKVWQKEKFVESEMDLKDISNISNKVTSDLRYWIADSQVREEGGIVSRVKRKFRLQ